MVSISFSEVSSSSVSSTDFGLDLSLAALVFAFQNDDKMFSKNSKF